MTVRAALILGFALIAAALVHGGVWTAGHDFVLNRFTGEWRFVPAEEWSDGELATHARALTPRGPDDRVAGSQRRR